MHDPGGEQDEDHSGSEDGEQDHDDPSGVLRCGGYEHRVAEGSRV